MIGKERCILYNKTEDYNNISIYMYKDSRIAIYWQTSSSKEYAKEYRDKHKKKYRACIIKNNKRNIHLLLNIKQGASCAICGYCKYPESLDFHHVNPQDKKYPIAANYISKKDFFDEMQKCICLCANCHRHITKIEQIKYYRR